MQSLTNAGLVDEYRILIHPVVMNEGKRLFEHLDGRTDLRLISVGRFERGAILVTYAPIRSLTGTPLTNTRRLSHAIAEGSYKLCLCRGPEGIILELDEQIK